MKRNRNFQREVGALIDHKGFFWDVILGDVSSLLYPDFKIWNMSKYVSNIILAHTHPPFFTSLSSEDFSTLKAWSYALPNRVEMWIICEVDRKVFVEKNKFVIESLQSWIKRGKVGEREIKLKTWPDFLMFRRSWVNRLLELSCL